MQLIKTKMKVRTPKFIFSLIHRHSRIFKSPETDVCRRKGVKLLSLTWKQVKSHYKHFASKKAFDNVQSLPIELKAIFKGQDDRVIRLTV